MSSELLLKDLAPYQSNFNGTVIVLDPGFHRRTQTGTIITMKVADSSGCINATLMNPEFSETFKGGDILKIRGGYGSVYQGKLTLSIGKMGECKKSGEFLMHFLDNPDFSQIPVNPAILDPRAAAGKEKNSRPYPSNNRYDRPPPNMQ